jgi:hypothetical protein
MSYVIMMINNYIVIFCILDAIRMILSQAASLESLLLIPAIMKLVLFDYLSYKGVTDVPPAQSCTGAAYDNVVGG